MNGELICAFLHQTLCEKYILFFHPENRKLHHISKNLLQALFSRSGATVVELVLVIITDWSNTRFTAPLMVKAKIDSKC